MECQSQFLGLVSCKSNKTPVKHASVSLNRDRQDTTRSDYVNGHTSATRATGLTIHFNNFLTCDSSPCVPHAARILYINKRKFKNQFEFKPKFFIYIEKISSPFVVSTTRAFQLKGPLDGSSSDRSPASCPSPHSAQCHPKYSALPLSL